MTSITRRQSMTGLLGLGGAARCWLSVLVLRGLFARLGCVLSIEQRLSGGGRCRGGGGFSCLLALLSHAMSAPIEQLQLRQRP